MPVRIACGALALLVAVACARAPVEEQASAAPARVLAARLGDGAGLAELQSAFAAANAGYALEALPALVALPAADAHRVVFVQTASPGAAARVRGGAGDAAASEVAVGDVVLLRPGAALEVDGAVSAVAFTVPGPLPAGLPAFVRPDQDPRITDTPGGCAEEEQAYRRILLTWREEVGPYVYHGLNAHRVRIVDSFSHYHPVEGGFDELYLVQSAPPGARLLTSEHVDWIEAPETLTRARAAALLQERPLRAGDLVYMPRGTMHRGLGGAVVQVITVPGFRPGAEVGLDHHLRAANEALGLSGADALPVHAAAAAAAVVK